MTLICSDLRPFLKSAPTDIGATKNGRSSVGADTELRSIPTSGATLTSRMSSWSRSSQRFFGRPRGRRPGGSMRRAVRTTESSSRRITWPYQRRRASRIFSWIGHTPSRVSPGEPPLADLMMYPIMVKNTIQYVSCIT